MFRDNSHPPGPQSWRKRLFVGHSKGIGIQYLCRLHQFIVTPTDCIRLFIHDPIISEFHIFGGELLSIMPEDTLSQEEGDHRFRTFLNLPGFCQFSNKVLKISIILNQSVENEAVDVTGG